MASLERDSGQEEDAKKLEHYPRHMSISELSDCARISATTIWYYTRMGLLPRPARMSKRKSYYTVRHLQILEQIRYLKGKGLSLSVIGEAVKGECDSSASRFESDSIYTSKRDSIIKAAIGLFHQKGYHTITIKDIVTKAGSGKVTFYQYFKDKQELFVECADHVFYDIGKDDPSIRDEQDGLKRLRNRAYSFHHGYLHMLDMLNLARGLSATRDNRFEQMLETVMHHLIAPIEDDLLKANRQGQINIRDIRRLAHILMGASEYCFYYRQHHPEKNVDDYFSKAWNLVLHGISSGLGNKLSVEKIPDGKHITEETPYSQRVEGKGKLSPAGKRDAILTISTRLFLEEGYAETSIADIVQQGKMSKETVYQHFKNKKEIFMACADRIFYHMYDEVWSEIKGERDLFLRLIKRAKAFFSSYSRWSSMMNLMKGLSVGDNPSFKSKFNQVVMQMVKPNMREIEALKREGSFRNDIDVELVSFILLGMAEYGAVLASRDEDSTEDILNMIAGILVKGLSEA